MRKIGARRLVIGLFIALAVIIPAFGLPYVPALTAVTAGAVSLATQCLKIVTDTELQVRCADDFRGRVFSLNDTAINVLFVVGLFFGSVVLPVDGHLPGALVGIGLAYLVLGGGTALGLGSRGSTATVTAQA